MREFYNPYYERGVIMTWFIVGYALLGLVAAILVTGYMAMALYETHEYTLDEIVDGYGYILKYGIDPSQDEYELAHWPQILLRVILAPFYYGYMGIWKREWLLNILRTGCQRALELKNNP